MFQKNINTESIYEKRAAVKKRRILVHPSTMFRNCGQQEITKLNIYHNHVKAMRTISANRQQQSGSVTISSGFQLPDQQVAPVSTIQHFLGQGFFACHA